MLMLKYVFICCLIIFIFIINKMKHNENYDARVSNVPQIEKCANMCSSVFGCGGFAHNKILEKCYLSKYPLTSPPLPSIFSEEYSKENSYCNKMFPINSDYSINNDMYVDNKVYDCYTKNAEFVGKKYFDINSTEKIIYMNDIYSLKSEPNNLSNLNWPTKNKDISFDSKFNIIYDRNEIGYKGDQLNESTGEYLNPSQCKTDTSLSDCLNRCTNNSDCVGVEYNTKFNKFAKVCCPKSSIGKKIRRRNGRENGIFYTKILFDINNSNKNNIII